MAQQESLRQGMLQRPRLHTLIQEGLKYPFFVMLAGPGYGKTQAMSSYLAESDADALWISLSSLDNLPAYFWDHLIRVLKRDFPELSASLGNLGFPDTILKFDSFLRTLKKSMQGQKQIIWVFDDYGQVSDEVIKDFFQILVEAELDNFRLVLLSNELNSTESIAFMTNRRFLILGDDLQFTRDEIIALYQMYGTSLEPKELDNIVRYTEGWPLSLSLLVQHNKKIPDSQLLDEAEVSHMFEEHFLSNHNDTQQNMLIKLSLLSFFTKELAGRIHSGDPADLEILENHAFINTEPATGQYTFHHQYHLFLQNKANVLSDDDRRRIWLKAAEYFEASGDSMEAIDCYRKCEDHIAMLNVVVDFAIAQFGMSHKTAAYFLEHLDLLTPEQKEEHPIADVIRALIYISILDMDRAEKLLLDLEQRLLKKGTTEADSLLGEVNVVNGFIHMMQCQENFGDYFKKAAHYLPEGSFNSPGGLRVYNNHSFSMQDNLPGAKERMEQAVHYGVHWLSKVLGGSMSGMEHIFSAEAAYLSYDLKEAQQHAYKGIYKAEVNAQHDLVCNGHAILARIGLLQGDYAEMTQQIENIVEYSRKCKMSIVDDICDTGLAWYYIKLHDYERMPKSIRGMTNIGRAVLTYGRSQIVYSNYLLNTGEYAKVIGMLEYPKGMYLSSGIRPDRITLFIMLAISYQNLGDMDAALKALWAAYDMTYHNKLTAPFIEAERHMCILINSARQQGTYKFDPEWLDLIYKKANSFSKRASAVRATYQQQNPKATVTESPLSKRESEVLQALSQGLTREEIAADQYISINTVKSVIRSIFNKLGVSNRAGAVSIAITRGYIEGHIFEQ